MRNDTEGTNHMTTAVHAAFNKSIEEELDKVAGTLQDRLGQRLVSYIVGLSTKTIGRWARGETGGASTAAAEGKLRAVYRVSLLFAERSDRTFRAWMASPNPYLGEEVPAEVLRNGEPQRVLNAATLFIDS
jgi:hypothetical protein